MISTTVWLPAKVESSTGSVWRLDGLSNPYAPVPALRDARRTAQHIAQRARDTAGLSSDRLAAILVARISRHHRISPDCITIAPGVSALLGALFAAAGDGGPVLVFPPSDDAPVSIAMDAGCELIALPRDASFQARASEERRPAAYVMAPNDPTGTPLRLQTAVALSRSVDLMIIDERHADYAPRNLLPLQREFDNVVLIRSLEMWGGPATLPLAYSIAAPARIDRSGGLLPPECIDSDALHAGIATFEDMRYAQAAVRRVVRERVDLIRALRKLNMVQPAPSVASFVLARIERGERDDLRAFLEGRGIALHYPAQPGLERTVRISAVSAAATRALSEALIDWGKGQ